MTTTEQPMHTGIPQTFFLEELVPRPFPSVDWLSRRLISGEIPGSKVGRRWVMTADDVAAALDILKNPKARPAVGPIGRRRTA
jgi:hypothetical protein